MNDVTARIARARNNFIRDQHDLFCAIDGKGLLEGVEERFASILGYYTFELEGRDLSEMVHPDDLERSLEKITEFRGSDEETFHIENRVKKKNGDYAWLRWLVVTDDNGYAYCVARDITKEKEVEFKMIEALKIAEQNAAAKSNFVANMSHEIRTPLNGIIGLTELLADTELDNYQAETLQTIKTSSDHLLSLLNDILDWTKIEADALTLESRPFSVRECLESCLDVVTPAARKKGVILDYRSQIDLPQGVMGDSHRIKQIVLNLLGNAVKFTESGSVQLRAWVSNQAPLTISFEVEDSGIGMTEEQIIQLFKPFQQADETISRKFGGTGLGLSIAHRLAARMGSGLTVASDHGVGSCFSFDLVTQLADVQDTDLLDPHGFLLGRRAVVLSKDPEHKGIMEGHLRRWKLKVEEEPTNQDLLIADLSGPEDKEWFEEIFEKWRGAILVITPKHYYEDGPRFREMLKPGKLTNLHDKLVELLGDGTKVQRKSQFDKNFATRYPCEILVAEDNAVNQEVMIRMLGKLGYKPILASNGEQAVAAAQGRDFDLILMDCQMPIMDGINAARAIRACPHHQPRIVAVSAHADASVQAECRAAGMDDYLMKPIRVGQLAKVISEKNNQEYVGSGADFDRTQWQDMVDLFGEELPQALSTFETDANEIIASIASDPKSLGHKLKGSAAMFGFNALANYCQEIEAGANLDQVKLAQLLAEALARTK